MKIKFKQKTNTQSFAPTEPSDVPAREQKTVVTKVKHVKSDNKLLWIILAAVSIDIIIGLIKLF